MIGELDRVRLRKDRPEDGLAAGAEGTVVLVYPGGRDVEVEFLDDDGWTLAVCTIGRDDLLPIVADPKDGRVTAPRSAARPRF